MAVGWSWWRMGEPLALACEEWESRGNENDGKILRLLRVHALKRRVEGRGIVAPDDGLFLHNLRRAHPSLL